VKVTKKQADRFFTYSIYGSL